SAQIIDSFEPSPDPLNPDEEQRSGQIIDHKLESEQITLLFSLSLSATENDPLAIFRRGRNLWVVIKRANALENTQISEAANRYIRLYEDISTRNETILRLIIDEDVNPNILFAPSSRNRLGREMLLNFYKQPMRNEQEINVKVEVDKLNGNPYILIADRQSQDMIELIDPGIGQRIVVMPSELKKRGIAIRHEYPDATIFPSLQGAAIMLKRDDLRVRRYDFGFTVSAEDRLNISFNENTTRREFLVEQLRFIDADDWPEVRPDRIIDTRDGLMYDLVQAPIQKRTSFRLSLVRFFLSVGWGSDAIGILNLAEEKEPSLTAAQEFQSYKIAAQYLLNRFSEAEQKLNSPKYIGFRDAAIWRAGLYGHQRKWPEAFAEFQRSESILRRYPVYLRNHFGLLYIRAALAVHHYGVVEEWINVINDHRAWLTPFQLNAMNYVEGQYALSSNDWLTARTKFDLVAAEDDLENQLEARYALISMDRREKNIDDKEVVKRLKFLRADARQTSIEVTILEQMVDIMLNQRDYLAAMRLMRMMTAMDLGDEYNRDLVSRMQQTLNDLFLNLESSESVLPIRTIAIFDEFRELTPVGKKGNRIINGLIRLLIRMDLLDQAEDMLAYQIRYRVFGAEKVRLGTKLAVVSLLNSNPALALKALNETQFGSISSEIGRHRRLLRAKAFANLGKKDDALKQLAGDISLQADLIRREIFWADKDWVELSKTIRRLITSSPTVDGALSDRQIRYILNWIVALQMQNNLVGVQEVVSQYREQMLLSKFAPVFSFLVADNRRASTDVIERVLAEGAVFDDFMNTYQAELLADDLENFVLEELDETIENMAPAA
ncbi:MAG: hypothetical protein HRT36_07220, partial [Alphaproteobacteria bacterium]|nr:hypothetical protein [Alphaproteobacteria bacterium]